MKFRIILAALLFASALPVLAAASPTVTVPESPAILGYCIDVTPDTIPPVDIYECPDPKV